ncbi:MAG: protocatechuate 3,4-dioxygenase subunit alpha [Silvibacterium sp.]|nr:protocatechuate 3,4-dioxygenase subunit alpha [Silvibacterium sp.]
MTTAKLTPSGSQTVGPYFAIGLSYLIERSGVVAADAETIEIRGRVLDRDGVPVPDAMLEFWTSNPRDASGKGAFPYGFRRVCVDDNGNFCALVNRPAPAPFSDGTMQSPHVLVLFFARGLLRHLISRLYFDDKPANLSDPVLLGIPAERRHTLIAKSEGANSFRWDVILQGPHETVFFAW